MHNECMNPVSFPHATLNDDHSMPLIGLGTYKLDGPDAIGLIREAIEVGYRHFDTAERYGNEDLVGQAVRDAIAAGDVTREELFLTSKVWNDDQTRAGEIVDGSLARSGLEYWDMFMVHWPWPQNGTFVAAYEALLASRGQGKIVSVAVANFYEETLDELIEATGVAPTVNQVELHTGFTQPELRDYHAKHGIITEAWAPLGRGEVLEVDTVTRIAQAHDATPAQIVLAHLMSHGISVIPKTASRARLEENFAATSISLSSNDLTELDRVSGGRQSADPRSFPG